MKALRKIIKDRIKILVKLEKQNKYSPNRVHYVNEYEFLTGLLYQIEENVPFSAITASVTEKRKAVRRFLISNKKHPLANHFLEASAVLTDVQSSLMRTNEKQLKIYQ